MRKTLSKLVDAEEIAEMADREQDVSAHFTNQFTVVRPVVERVDVDFTAPVPKKQGSRGRGAEYQPSGRHQDRAARLWTNATLRSRRVQVVKN